jgi:hypothetical protein
MNIIMIFPAIVCVRIALPLDQVLLLLPSAVMLLVQNGLDLVFLLSIDDIWGRFKVIGPMFGGFLVW